MTLCLIIYLFLGLCSLRKKAWISSHIWSVILQGSTVQGYKILTTTSTIATPSVFHILGFHLRFNFIKYSVALKKVEGRVDRI